jgi:hypothetical protein
MSDKFSRPVPQLTPESAAYWHAAADGRLTVGYCRTCTKVHHYPQAVCPFCWSSDVELKTASGRGKVNSFVVVHQTAVEGFGKHTPYVTAYVELEEGPSLVTNIVGCDVNSVSINMPVQVTFDKVADDVAVPVFEPAN